MPDVNALTYLTLQNAVLGRRFPSASRPDAKRWLATAYQDVWSAEDWTFKRVSRANLTMTAGDTTPTMPPDFGQAIELYDADGFPLLQLSQEEFEYRYADVLVQGTSGSPEAYTTVNRQIQVAPAPGNSTFTLSYRRRLSSRTSALAVQGGMMNLDGDYPLWDDHHSILIPRAIAIGLQELNDPTWQDPQAEFERQLERMKEDYVQQRPQKQWQAYSF